MASIPTEEELTNYYNIYSYQNSPYISPATISSYNKLLDEFEKFRKLNRILDVGCGAGDFLEIAKHRGWEVHGTEFSETAYKINLDKGIKITKGILKTENYPVESFDVITSFEVLEHINNPVKEIQKVHTLLRKNGLFYCTTPNFNSISRYLLKQNYNIITYPEHLSYYTPKTLKFLMNNNGFTTKKILCTGISFSRLEFGMGIQSHQDSVKEKSTDEKLRLKIEKRWHLKIIKKIINFLLTFTSKGVTIKGYYTKK
ncbi:MAG: class I SAM-dependent methyltransferase [Cytophagaceae bacterium]